MPQMKLTPEVTERITRLIRLGNCRETAAAAAGISSRTLRNWCMWGADGREPYTEFCDALEAAEAEIEKNVVIAVIAAAKKDWKAAAWWLERRHPNRWRDKKPTAIVEGSAEAENVWAEVTTKAANGR